MREPRLDEYGFEIYEENVFPIAYLLTFRTYGTWLHGDDRSSVRRNGNNRFGGVQVTPSVPLNEAMNDSRQQQAFVLDVDQRRCVQSAIIEVCEFRNYLLRAINIRTIMATWWLRGRQAEKASRCQVMISEGTSEGRVFGSESVVAWSSIESVENASCIGAAPLKVLPGRYSLELR